MALQWLPTRCPRCNGSVLIERDFVTGEIESLCVLCARRVSLSRPARRPDLTRMPDWMRAAAAAH